jgi:hypothetical protein
LSPSLFARLPLEVHVEQIPDPLHGDVVVVVAERRKRVLEDVGRVREKDEGEEAAVHAVRVVYPLGQDGLLDLDEKKRDLVRDLCAVRLDMTNCLKLTG